MNRWIIGFLVEKRDWHCDLFITITKTTMESTVVVPEKRHFCVGRFGRWGEATGSRGVLVRPYGRLGPHDCSEATENWRGLVTSYPAVWRHAGAVRRWGTRGLVRDRRPAGANRLARDAT